MLTTLSCLDVVLDVQPNVCRVRIIMRDYSWISAYSLPEIKPAGYAAPHSRAPCFLDIYMRHAEFLQSLQFFMHQSDFV